LELGLKVHVHDERWHANLLFFIFHANNPMVLFYFRFLTSLFARSPLFLFFLDENFFFDVVASKDQIYKLHIGYTGRDWGDISTGNVAPASEDQ
jgi:hypothetical protein